MQNSNAIILGHSGFIGNEVLNRLRSRKITVLGLSSKDIDLCDSKSSLKLSKLFSKKTILIIASAITREHGDNISNMQKNIQMIVNIAKAIQMSPIKKCVFLSTADVYGKPNKPIKETLPLDPQTYYALAKTASEKLLEITTSITKTSLLILRYNGVFGPGQINFGYGPNFFIKFIKENDHVTIWGDGRELRDTLYVKDLARIICSLSLDNTSGIFNVASGKSQSFIDILKILKKISPKIFKIEKRKRTAKKFDQVFDISKLKKVLPDYRFTPVEKAFTETYLSFNKPT